jgi:hypothetical protein
MAFGVPIPPLMLPYMRTSVLPSTERRYGVGFRSVSEATGERESRVCYQIPSPCVRCNKYSIKQAIRYSVRYSVTRRAPFGSPPRLAHFLAHFLKPPVCRHDTVAHS